MNSKTVVVRGIEVITVIFAGFNGFITNWAPPTGNFSKTSFEVGFTSFIALIILLLIFTISKNYANCVKKQIWVIVAAIFLISAVILGLKYQSKINDYVAVNPKNTEEKILVGSELTEDAKKYSNATGFRSNDKLLEKFGGVPDLENIWTKESIKNVRSLTSKLYIAFVLSICIAIFSITEGVIVENCKNNLKAKKDEEVINEENEVV